METATARIEPGRLDLTRQSKLILVGRSVAEGTMTVDEAMVRDVAVEREPEPPSRPTLLAGTAVVGAASRLLGGGWARCMASWRSTHVPSAI
jgi:uncharacterized membrane protein YjjP (DUF1212 family)